MPSTPTIENAAPAATENAAQGAPASAWAGGPPESVRAALAGAASPQVGGAGLANCAAADTTPGGRVRVASGGGGGATAVDLAALKALIDDSISKAVGEATAPLHQELGAIDLERLLRRWESVRGPVPPGASYYSFPGHREPPSTQVDAWLKVVLDHLGAKAPEGETWSGHSLRIGAASAMDAVGVTLRRICHMGGWSSQSSAVKDYIDPTCPCSSAGRRYFGWLLPG